METWLGTPQNIEKFLNIWRFTLGRDPLSNNSCPPPPPGAHTCACVHTHTLSFRICLPALIPACFPGSLLLLSVPGYSYTLSYKNLFHKTSMMMPKFTREVWLMLAFTICFSFSYEDGYLSLKLVYRNWYWEGYYIICK